jgi:hypothetical protein
MGDVTLAPSLGETKNTRAPSFNVGFCCVGMAAGVGVFSSVEGASVTTGSTGVVAHAVKSPMSVKPKRIFMYTSQSVMVFKIGSEDRNYNRVSGVNYLGRFGVN